MKRSSINVCCCVAALLLAAGCTTREPFTIVSYNVCHGEGMDRRVDLNRTACTISSKTPRFAAVQELDTNAKRSGYVNEPEKLGEVMGMYPAFGAGIPFDKGHYGVCLFSREKPQSVKRIPLPGKEPRVLVLAEFEDCRVGCTHLDLVQKNRLDSIPILKREIMGSSKPTFLCGDWNCMTNSPELAEIKTFMTILSDTTGRTYHGHVLNGPSGTSTDFCIDYIAIDNDHAAEYRVTDKGIIEDRRTSDHAPIFVSLGNRN